MNQTFIATARFCSLLLASSLFLGASPSPAMLGGPLCPAACPKICELEEQSPSEVDNLCIEITLFWGRKQNGCASEPGCTDCRQCLAVAVYEVKAAAGTCMVPDIKFQAGGDSEVELPTLPNGNGFADGRDLVVAICDASASYTVQAWLPTSPTPDSKTIAFECKPCMAQ